MHDHSAARHSRRQIFRATSEAPHALASLLKRLQQLTTDVTSGARWTLIGPILLTALLLRVSGVDLLEQDLRQRKAGYAEYVARPSAFVPWFPKPL